MSSQPEHGGYRMMLSLDNIVQHRQVKRQDLKILLKRTKWGDKHACHTYYIIMPCIPSSVMFSVRHFESLQ